MMGAILTDTAHAAPLPTPHSTRERIALFATYGVAMVLFFRGAILSGFDLGFSDRGDGVIEIGLLEHWRNVLAGNSNWAITGYFHPHTGTLGYNDGYFLYGLVYSFWRLFADPFLADTLNIFTFKTIGFFAAYYLVSHSLCWGRRSGLFVALIFTIASGMTIQGGHQQLHSVTLLPVAMMLAIAAVRAERAGQKTRSRAAAVALAALLAAWLMTAYYMAWFTIFFTAIYVAIYSCLIIIRDWRVFWAALRGHIVTLEIFAFSLVLFLIPFLRIYLPKQRETGGHPFTEHAHYLVRPLDLINVGRENYLWGWFFKYRFSLVSDPAKAEWSMGGEHVTGFAPLLFILVIVAAGLVIARRRPGQSASVEVRALALALILSWILTIRLFGGALWHLVYDLVPGAGGIRVVLRYQLFLILPALLVVVAAYRDPAQRLSRARPWLMIGLIVLLTAEQIGGATGAFLSRSLHGTELSAIPAPPPTCRAFYIVQARKVESWPLDDKFGRLYPHNVDAMFLAQRWKLPTLNGFSTFNPPDWEFADPLASSYDFRVMGYVRRHQLRHVCRLDMRDTQPWRLMPETQ